MLDSCKSVSTGCQTAAGALLKVAHCETLSAYIHTRCPPPPAQARARARTHTQNWEAKHVLGGTGGLRWAGLAAQVGANQRINFKLYLPDQASTSGQARQSELHCGSDHNNAAIEVDRPTASREWREGGKEGRRPAEPGSPTPLLLPPPPPPADCQTFPRAEAPPARPVPSPPPPEAGCSFRPDARQPGELRQPGQRRRRPSFSSRRRR